VTARALTRLLALYAIVLVLACASLRACVKLPAARDTAGEEIASVWSKGQLIAREVVANATEVPPSVRAALASDPGATAVVERVVAEGPILARPEIAFAMSLVPGIDGVRATLDGRVAYVTPDDLLSRQGYDKGHSVAELSLGIGTDIPLVLAMLADRLHAPVPEIVSRASLRRVRVRRYALDGAAPALVPLETTSPTADALDGARVRDAAVAAARHLALGVREDGRFRYFIDAPTNKTLGGYDWPRHAGATYFLAQSTRLVDDLVVGSALLRASALLANGALGTCGDDPCVGTDDIADVGSTALATIALAEVARHGTATQYRHLVGRLARFLRNQQRPDGEFMHQYDRRTHRRIDVQFLYYSGEATLALARAAAITQDPEDLAAASRGLAHLVGPAWHFFGSRYYFGEEHWTCQAMGDLWDAAPNPTALDFCLRWHAQNRLMQFRASDAPFDVDGSFGVTPVVTPRLTPVGSRCEAAVATLDAARKAGVARVELDALEAQLRRSLALVIRQQMGSRERRHLFADPRAVEGAMPGSHVDWQLRIDYAQHSGSAMIRWLEVMRPPKG
jgi:hypothetical protein